VLFEALGLAAQAEVHFRQVHAVHQQVLVVLHQELAEPGVADDVSLRVLEGQGLHVNLDGLVEPLVHPLVHGGLGDIDVIFR